MEEIVPRASSEDITKANEPTNQRGAAFPAQSRWLLCTTNEWSVDRSMLPFEPSTLCCELKTRHILKMPRVVSNQRAKFDNDEIFRKLSRECEVSRRSVLESCRFNFLGFGTCTVLRNRRGSLSIQCVCVCVCVIAGVRSFGEYRHCTGHLWTVRKKQRLGLDRFSTSPLVVKTVNQSSLFSWRIFFDRKFRGSGFGRLGVILGTPVCRTVLSRHGAV